jgi:UDP-N-acetyl-D-glucosamine dehydrogenase
MTKFSPILRRRILTRDAQVAIVGQGYVGLSLACAAANAGFTVTGIDIDARRTAGLAAGELCVPGADEEAFRRAVAIGRLHFTTALEDLATADVICICVPTPVRDRTPDLSQLEQACLDVARQLTGRRMVILESTSYPGTTSELVVPLLETSGLRVGDDFLLAYSPERIDPGNKEFDFGNTPRIVGGTTPEATTVAMVFYEQMTNKVVTVSSPRIAELAKLLENTFRHVNIAMVNELAMLCHGMGIDVWEVIQAAATKPFGFMAFTPGPGIGGHCIPIAPIYLAWQVRRDAGRPFKLLEQAQEINAEMPIWVAGRIDEALNKHAKPLNGSHVLVLGVTYKPDINDVRESPSLRVMSILARGGARLSFHDPFVDAITVEGKRLGRTELTARVIGGADLVALLTPHNTYDLGWLARISPLLFDARNALNTRQHTNVVQL